jgi:hypothetical protein
MVTSLPIAAAVEPTINGGNAQSNVPLEEIIVIPLFSDISAP